MASPSTPLYSDSNMTDQQMHTNVQTKSLSNVFRCVHFLCGCLCDLFIDNPLLKLPPRNPPESTRIPPRIPPVPVLRHSCQSQAIFLVEQWFIMMFLNWFNKWNQTRSFHAESLYSFNWLGSEELRVLVQIWRYLSLQIKPIWSIWLTVAYHQIEVANMQFQKILENWSWLVLQI